MFRCAFIPFVGNARFVIQFIADSPPIFFVIFSTVNPEILLYISNVRAHARA